MTKDDSEGARKGTVKNRIQMQNPITGTFIKLDTETGRILEEKKSPGPFKGVRILRNTKAS